MSILVIERIVIPLLTEEYRRVASFNEELKRVLFEEFLRRYNIAGSLNSCDRLESVLGYLDADEIRSVAEDIIRKYLRRKELRLHLHSANYEQHLKLI